MDQHETNFGFTNVSKNIFSYGVIGFWNSQFSNGTPCIFNFAADAMRLVLSERKSINTLTYLILILMAYYGPNAGHLGNIKLAIWHFQRPITDIEAFVIKVSILLAVDLFSFLVNGMLLWKFCNVNVLKILEKLQREFWIYFAVAEGYILMEVLIQSLICW